MRVLGIAGALNHDAAVSVIEDGKILFAAHAERYSKKKNDAMLNQEIISAALEFGKPDVIAWYERPVIKKLRQLIAGQFSLAFDSNELPSKYLETFPQLDGIPIEYQYHHYTHAASGYFTSKFDDAAIVVIDSIGEFDTISIWEGKGNKIKQLYSQQYSDSLGLFYSAMTQRLGLKPQEDEYILMGMAAYGDAERMIGNNPLYKKMMYDFGIYSNYLMMHPKNVANIYHTEIGYHNDILIHINKNFHKGCLDYMPEMTTEQDMFDLAAATQYIYEMMLKEIILYTKAISESKNLVLMGGCALNCSANTTIAHDFDNIWIMPNPGDAGSCIGASQKYFDERIRWESPYLGHEIKGEYPVSKVLSELLQGKIVGVASGKAEFGPRALGNRSLLADPRQPHIKDEMNKIKQRQMFRPFAPVIMEEFADTIFEMPTNVKASPYMQFVARCNYPELYPAIVHKDGTSRVQTVNSEQHPELYELLRQFHRKTGCPMLMNTSLNIKGMPIVNDESDAKAFEEHYGVKVFTSI